MGEPVLVGTVTLDLLHEGPIGAGRSPVVLRWGGVMNNMACALGMRGADPALVTASYTGELAGAVGAHLADNQVRWTPLPATSSLPVFHAELASGSVQHKVFLADNAMTALTPAGLGAQPSLFDGAGVVVAGTDAEEGTLAWLADAARARAVPFWMLSADPTEVSKLQPHGRTADLVALNLAELSRWAGRPPTGRADIAGVARELVAPGGRCLVTLGSEGALLVAAGDEMLFQPAPAIDNPSLTVGAGDVMLGCLLAARLTGAGWAAALAQASAFTGVFLRGLASARNPYHVLRGPVPQAAAGIARTPAAR